MTINGFNALESIAPTLTQPFQEKRCGINIGEGAALFIMSSLKSDVKLSGFGETSDAYHISAPDPKAYGAIQAMKKALERAKLKEENIDYINLHGTGTLQNDAMEAKAVGNVFKNKTPCSASKPLHGHCLGASGAIEAGLCWLLLSPLNEKNHYPMMPFFQSIDPSLKIIHLIQKNEANRFSLRQKLQHCMSNSYAFGGNNASLILSKTSLK
jgi:3-oxoacyl-[acyl-carrier-protein] synthase-1